MGHKTKIYFATDLHGATLCFRKFLNAGKFYGADVLVLGGDVAGKAIQAITRGSNGKWHCNFIGVDYDVEEGPGLDDLERLIEGHGYYPYRAEPGEMVDRQANGTMDALFLELMSRRLESWLSLADERLRPTGKTLYFMLGNDDPTELKSILERAHWGTQAEGRVLLIDDEHEMMSWGYSNITPWHSYREQDELQMRQSLDQLATQLQTPHKAIVNVHVPPYGTQLDDAPLLDENLRVQASLGQVKFAPAGSTAVRDFLVETQPLLGLHGHIHEATGIRRLGRTIAINPGSDYSTGALNGCLVTLEGDRVLSHQLVRG